ncbi:unnamed protein product [Oppiella nova]|uniref:Uncharacterized protein n=1 Tax=Oppiella nova TaxID=334625 RepID=A0A7R9QRL7_9ACAR|nr:unnamed protein product [Oppiella nova]CAG2172427.1 unnamed protein product [Oppiella nova]
MSCHELMNTWKGTEEAVMIIDNQIDNKYDAFPPGHIVHIRQHLQYYLPFEHLVQQLLLPLLTALHEHQLYHPEPHHDECGHQCRVEYQVQYPALQCHQHRHLFAHYHRIEWVVNRVDTQKKEELYSSGDPSSGLLSAYIYN